MPWAAHEPSGPFAGFVLALGLFNLLTAFVLKQRARLVYAGVAALAFVYFSYPSENAFFAWVTVAATASFAIVFLDLPEYDAPFERTLIAGALASTAYPLAVRFAPGAATLQAVAWGLLVFTLLAIVAAGVRAQQRDYPGARFFIVGAAGACACAFVPNLFGAGLAWEALLMTAALTDRMIEVADEEIDVPKGVSRAALQVLAELDPLTGVPNRRAFDEHVEAEWERSLHSGGSIGLIMVDVDHFKDYNDRLGHVEGDVCLSRIAKACAGALKRSGDFFARYGGEEFVAIVATRSDGDLVLVAERMRRAVSDEGMQHPTNPDGLVTISLGTARMHPTPDGTPMELVAAADEALYEAKSRGRNCVRATFAQT